MKIVLTTPLYPPDSAALAVYVKELARRLAPNHRVTIVAYTHLPEAVAGVDIVAVDKRHMLPVRLFFYTLALWRAARNADSIYSQNGASVELAVWLVALLTRRPLIMHIGDRAAHAHAAADAVRGFIKGRAFGVARAILEDTPPQKPEILPFSPRPEAALRAWEAAWQRHLADVSAHLSHV